MDRVYKEPMKKLIAAGKSAIIVSVLIGLFAFVISKNQPKISFDEVALIWFVITGFVSIISYVGENDE